MRRRCGEEGLSDGGEGRRGEEEEEEQQQQRRRVAAAAAAVVGGAAAQRAEEAPAQRAPRQRQLPLRALGLHVEKVDGSSARVDGLGPSVGQRLLGAVLPPLVRPPLRAREPGHGVDPAADRRAGAGEPAGDGAGGARAERRRAVDRAARRAERAVEAVRVERRRRRERRLLLPELEGEGVGVEGGLGRLRLDAGRRPRPAELVLRPHLPEAEQELAPLEQAVVVGVRLLDEQVVKLARRRRRDVHRQPEGREPLHDSVAVEAAVRVGRRVVGRLEATDVGLDDLEDRAGDLLVVASVRHGEKSFATQRKSLSFGAHVCRRELPGAATADS